MGLPVSAEHRADAVRGVVHRRHAGPVGRPVARGHLLVVRGADELDAAELALRHQLLHEQVLAGEDGRLHHAVLLARLLLRLDDQAALLDGARHRHGACHVLARLQRVDAHPGVLVDGRVDMHRIHVRIGDQLGEISVARRDAELIAHFVQVRLVPLADGVDVGVGVALVDRDELRAEPHADDGDVEFTRHWVVSLSRIPYCVFGLPTHLHQV